MKPSKDISQSLQAISADLGAGYFGVADLAPAREAILEQGGAEIASFPRSITIGIALLHSIVDQLPRRAERAAAITYRQHGYEIVNQRLDAITSRLANDLQRNRWQAYPVSASKRVDDQRLCAVFSHKMGAHLAGLGWIGKNCLLITPDIGPRVRWATVLTDAPLEPTGQPMQERCGDCRECVDICPVKAFTGKPFRSEESRQARYDANKCDQYFSRLKEKDAETAVCGLCLYICPYGRPAVSKQ